MLSVGSKEVKFIVRGPSLYVETVSPVSALEYAKTYAATIQVVVGEMSFDTSLENLSRLAYAFASSSDKALKAAMRGVMQHA